MGMHNFVCVCVILTQNDILVKSATCHLRELNLGGEDNNHYSQPHDLNVELMLILRGAMNHYEIIFTLFNHSSIIH
jgi:hypothetical protein